MEISARRTDRPGRASFSQGLAAGSPIMVGVASFGLIYGATALALGLSPGQTVGMSLAVFAGSSQLVFLDLWGRGASSLAGYLAGAMVPESWSLKMAVPLVFLALLIPMLALGPKLTAALAAMVVAVTAAWLPMNLGLILAIFVGIAAGLFHSRLRRGES